MNPPKAERAKPSLSSDYNLLFKNKIGERSLDIHLLGVSFAELMKKRRARKSALQYQPGMSGNQ